MNQHICLPKSTLREFTYNHRLYYLDLKENLIKCSTARSFNTEENYYPVESETYLSEVETQIGILRKQVKEFELGRSNVIISPSLKDKLIYIFDIQLMRLPDLRRLIQSKSVFASILGLPEDFYSPLHHKTEVLKESINNAYSSVTSSIFKNYSANIIEIIKDKRERSFLLPSSHFIGYGSHLILVLTPYWGITLIPESENRQLLHEGKDWLQ